VVKQTQEDFGLDEILREHGFSQTSYSDEARLRIGCTEWHRRDPLGNEHYVLDYSNGRWVHTTVTGDIPENHLTARAAKGLRSGSKAIGVSIVDEPGGRRLDPCWTWPTSLLRSFLIGGNQRTVALARFRSETTAMKRVTTPLSAI
jgi:hypothetical protein